MAIVAKTFKIAQTAINRTTLPMPPSYSRAKEPLRLFGTSFPALQHRVNFT